MKKSSNREERKQKNQGITLIVLVITIIILLILAGVTITGITEDHSIIKNANHASHQTEIKSLEEQVELAIIKAEQKHRNPELEDIIEELKSSKIITNENQVDTITGKITTNNGYEIDGKLDDYVGITTKDIANSEDKGIYYGAEVTGYECKNSEAVAIWRIFYADENNIYLIADDSINPVYAPKTKTGKTLTITENSKKVASGSACSDYEGSKWIEGNSLAKKWFKQFLETNPDCGNINAKMSAYMMDTSIWNVFAGNKAEYAIGGNTIELFCASYQDTHPDKYIVYTIGEGEKGYKAKWSDGSDDTYGYVRGIKSNDFNKIYVNDSKIFWMASPYFEHSALLMRVSGFGGSYGDLDSYWSGYAQGELRPMVCLKSDVKLKRIEEGIYAIK